MVNKLPNKLTVTFDQLTIIGNYLSASFGRIVKKNKMTKSADFLFLAVAVLVGKSLRSLMVDDCHLTVDFDFGN
jgi:uncharacterized membrane protein YwzB